MTGTGTNTDSQNIRPLVVGRKRRARASSRNWMGLLGLFILLVMVLVSICAPLLSPYSPDMSVLSQAYKAPSGVHWFGTDDLGRDILSRVIYGSRLSLTVGIVSVIIGGSIGTALGLLAGFYRHLDGIVMRIMDILLAFPGIILALAIVAALGSGEQNVIIATSVFSIPGFARLVRSMTLSIKNELFVDAARIVGCSSFRIMFRHILPNIMSPIIVQSTIRVGTSILISAGLSYLGLGAQPPTPDWGAMVSEGQVSIYTSPWISAYPGLAIFIVVVSINLFGDWLRDWMDPKSASGR